MPETMSATYPQQCPRQNLQRTLTNTIVGIELCFLYTALLFNVIYLYVKFEVTCFCTLKVMPWTKIQSKNLQRAITPKII